MFVATVEHIISALPIVYVAMPDIDVVSAL
jgi:hypothetical protein